MLQKRIIFVCIGAEYLGVEYISAMLKKAGHKVDLAFDPSLFDDKYWLYIPFLNRIFDREKQVIKKIMEFKPDFIAFSALTDTYQKSCKIAKEVRKHTDAKIVFGGIHTTSVPEVVIKNDFVDYLIVGEGEYAMLDLVEGRTKAKNIWSKDSNGNIMNNGVRPLIENLDSLPFPDKNLFSKHYSQRSYLIMTTRDCPFNCTYCCNSVLHKIYGFANRRRTPQNVLDELHHAKKKYNIKHIHFVDDNFILDKKWLKEFLPRLKKEIGLPFRCLSYPTAINYPIAKLLKDHGCEAIDIGIQSLNEDIKKNILNRHETNEQVTNTLTSLKAAKLKFHVDHIVGLPGETEKDLIDAVKFYNEHRADRFIYYYLSYFPNTEIIRKARLSRERIDSINNGYEKMYLVGGSVDNKLTRNFEILFKLIVLLPKKIVTYIIDKRLYRYFRFLPISLLIDILTTIKRKEFKDFDYMKYYLRHMFRLNIRENSER